MLVPPDSMLHKTDKMAWDEEFLGSLGDLGSRKRAFSAMDDGIDAETRAKVEAASRAFRNIRSNYGEAKQFGPARFSPDNTRLLMVRRLEALPDEVRQALAARGLPVEAHGGDLNAAYEMARAAQRGQRFMPIKPLSPTFSDPSPSVVKHFGLGKADFWKSPLGKALQETDDLMGAAEGELGKLSAEEAATLTAIVKQGKSAGKMLDKLDEEGFDSVMFEDVLQLLVEQGYLKP